MTQPREAPSSCTPCPSSAIQPPRTRRFPFAVILLLLTLVPAASLRADTISGTVRDRSGAVVAGARIEIVGGTRTQPLVLNSDEAGKFTAPDLGPGNYSVRVYKEGFEPLVSAVDLQGSSDLQLTLKIAEQQTSVNVTAKSAAFANSDSAYRQLRNEALGDSYPCENFKFNMDVGGFELKTGTITFLAPVNGAVTGAVFVGQGHFTLKPIVASDIREMQRRSGSASAEEDFTEAVFRFSDGVYENLKSGFIKKVDSSGQAISAFQHWKNRVRHRNEVPQGFTESLLDDETMDNVDADVLAAIYNPRHPAFFNAYMVGNPHKDLRYFMRLRVGALPQMQSPEEVALINRNGGGMDDGIWYSEHTIAELKANSGNSLEDRRLFATHNYKIETVIGKNNHFFSSAAITFAPLVEGERVLKFGLLPTLRVTRVADENGKDLHFIQENRKEDGTFYAILDEAVPVGKEHTISVEYAGDKVLYNAGGGSYYVESRTSWYPNLNGFGEKSLYDLTFKVPKSNVVISVGQLQHETTEEGFQVSRWVTPVPVAVAGFNYGRYVKLEMPDAITHYDITGYYLTELPDALAPYKNGALSGMAPGSMTKYALDQARAQMQVCTLFYGRAPYENVAITEQPNFNFGQSWPSLVYLPVFAYIDSTQRWLLFGRISSSVTGFVQEVTPHEVAHQWFGHSVTWASYHDLWLSEGFADFSAGLFLQQATGPKWQKDYLEYWERQRTRILEKNNFGISPNDAGPLWMGLRLISPRSEQGYQGLTYSKGAYVLNMLRSMMYDDHATSGSKDHIFIDMMHDFIASHQKSPASTESFKAIAEKHMPKELDLQHNGHLDWFFQEWVYGTQVPRYQFTYDVESAGSGAKIKMEITQSDVDQNFAMPVPVFADFGNGLVRMGQVTMIGNSKREIIFNVDRQPKKVVLNAYKDILERK